MIVGGECRVRCGQRRLDRSRAGFEDPVAALLQSARIVNRRGDIGPRQLGEAIDEGGAIGARADVATIEQDVGPRLQRRTPARQFGGMIVQPGKVQLRGSKAEAGLEAVREDVNRGHTGAAGQIIRNLRDLATG